MDIYIRGVPTAEQYRAEEAIRRLLPAVLTTPLEPVFKHTDSPKKEVDISVPQLNGEMRVSAVQFVEQVGEAVRGVTGGIPITCRMRGTHTQWHHW